ncbi:MAG: ABC transporter substrate-binding protein [Patulibacter sp.]
MPITRRVAAASATVTALAMLAAGCGSSDSGTETAATTTTAAAQAGGTLTAYWSAFPDYLDPALSYTQEGWTTLWPVYTGLLTYKHAEGTAGAELAPGLAEALPEISDDGLTYKLKLRSGLKYSDGTPVKASDFQRTIQRVLHLESGGSGYYQSIKGADDYIKAGKPKAPIEGIETDDDTGDITITLAKPDGQFSFYLAMDFAGLVPGTTKFDNLTDAPPPGVGPYMFSDIRGSRSWKLVRNPNFTALPNVPAAKADEIDISVVKNQRRQVEDVLADKVDLLFDAPTTDLLPRVKQEAAGRFAAEVTNSVYYYFLNQRVAPFDNAKVRQAVAYAVDPRALQRIYGGLMSPTCNFLPPDMSGFKKIDPCPYGALDGDRDLQKAKQLIAQAGAEGEQVTVWGDDLDTTKASTEYIADVLTTIGLKATPKTISGETYFQTIGNQKTKAQIGFANWFQDFPHPASFMFLVNGGTIQDTNNQNFGNVDDPEINKLIDTANQSHDFAAVAAKYEEADRRLIEQADVVPIGNRELTKLTSSRVAFDAFKWHPVYQQDLTTLGLK